MSVLACNRYGCNNVMCDHLSRKHGYICRECLNELIDGGPTSIDDFMVSDKRKPPHTGEDWKRTVMWEFTEQL